MPEAVIVATGRSPIGRAMKGSLVELRPDDLGSYIVDRVLEKVPQLPRDDIEDLICGCGLPGGEQGFNLGRAIAILSRLDVPGTNFETLQTLKPVFREDGKVTAGNSCPLNDGAAAVVIMSDTRARELGITPLARIVATGLTSLEPEYMGLGPIEASRNAMRNAGMSIDDIDVVEINEAFAAQV